MGARVRGDCAPAIESAALSPRPDRRRTSGNRCAAPEWSQSGGDSITRTAQCRRISAEPRAHAAPGWETPGSHAVAPLRVRLRDASTARRRDRAAVPGAVPGAGQPPEQDVESRALEYRRSLKRRGRSALRSWCGSLHRSSGLRGRPGGRRCASNAPRTWMNAGSSATAPESPNRQASRTRRARTTNTLH